jgi:hypothetical protein
LQFDANGRLHTEEEVDSNLVYRHLGELKFDAMKKPELLTLYKDLNVLGCHLADLISKADATTSEPSNADLNSNADASHLMRI